MQNFSLIFQFYSAIPKDTILHLQKLKTNRFKNRCIDIVPNSWNSIPYFTAIANLEKFKNDSGLIILRHTKAHVKIESPYSSTAKSKSNVWSQPFAPRWGSKVFVSYLKAVPFYEAKVSLLLFLNFTFKWVTPIYELSRILTTIHIRNRNSRKLTGSRFIAYRKDRRPDRTFPLSYLWKNNSMNLSVSIGFLE